MYRALATLLGAASLVAACGDDTPDFPDGGPGDGGAMADECSEAEPCPLAPGERGQAFLAEVGDEDTWTFELPETGRVLNLVVGNDVMFSPVRLEAALFGPGGEAIVNQRFPSDQGPQRVEIQLLIETAGAHRLVVRDVGRDGADRRNPYYVEFSILDNEDRNEPNDTAPEATPLTPGTPSAGVIGAQGDLDWFSVNVVAGDLLEVEVSAPGVGPVRHRWSLWAPDGTTRIAESNEPTADEPWPIDVRAVSVAGRYLVRIEDNPDDGVQADQSRIYQITVRTRAQPDPQEGAQGNDTTDRASPVTPGTPVEGYVASTADVDWYAVDVGQASEANPQIISAEVQSPAGSPVNLSLTLFEPDGERWICERREGDGCGPGSRTTPDGSPDPQRLVTSYPVFAPGRYLVSVRDLQDNAFDGDRAYTLTISLPNEPDQRENYGLDEREASILIGASTSSAGTSIDYPEVSGFLSYAGDTDWYRFDIPGPSEMPGQNGDWLVRVELNTESPNAVELNAFFFGPEGSARESYRGFGPECRGPPSAEDPNPCQYPDEENDVSVDFQTSLDGSTNDCFVVFREVTGEGPHYWRVSDLDRDDSDRGQPYRLRMSLTAGCPANSGCQGRFTDRSGNDLCGRP